MDASPLNQLVFNFLPQMQYQFYVLILFEVHKWHLPKNLFLAESFKLRLLLMATCQINFTCMSFTQNNTKDKQKIECHTKVTHQSWHSFGNKLFWSLEISNNYLFTFQWSVKLTTWYLQLLRHCTDLCSVTATVTVLHNTVPLFPSKKGVQVKWA